MLWTVATILAGYLIVDFVSRCFAARLILPVFERKPPFGGAPHVPDKPSESVLFSTTNRLQLRGRIYRTSQQVARGVIIFCPEMEGDSRSALYYCKALVDAGFDVFAFDYRNQGESDSLAGYEPLHWVTEYEVEDTLAAVRFVKHQSEWAELPLGIVGISRGGGAALAAASRCSVIQQIACEGAFTTDGLMEYYTLRWAALYIPQWLMNLFPLWHVRITLGLVRRISQFRRGCRYLRLQRELPKLRDKPVLIIHGEKDSYVPKVTATELVRGLPTNAEFWQVPKANHNKARETSPLEYDRKLVAFFEPMCLGESVNSPEEVEAVSAVP